MLRRKLPNLLTLLRLALAAVFFLVLNQYRYADAARETSSLDANGGAILWWAMGLFIVASLTDVADGYLARRWEVESTFGRIMDPFVDKVLVLGALIYLAGPRFVDPGAVAEGRLLNMVSGLYPWMVTLMLARELLVTGIRGEMESRGVRFGAKGAGKLKTLLQSIGIPVILAVVALDPNRAGLAWMGWVRDAFAYGMTLMTIVSGYPYVAAAWREAGGGGGRVA